ncbi:MAG TPA: YtxH domain-containing protein [Aquihabitans sp.]|nr:YtxH domain-containing protein [Aquihabitans sp.]
MLKLLVVPFKAVRLFFKLSGVKGGLLFGIGVLVGLLVAPQTGPELRARLQAKVAGRRELPVEGDLLA